MTPASTSASTSAPPPLPKSAEVAIIGGGIVGCSAAFFLAKWGVPVVLCEKAQIGCEQSSRNWGFVRQQGRDPVEIPLMSDSLQIWRGLAAECAVDIGFRQFGSLYIADSDKRMQAFETWLKRAKPYELDSRLVSSTELTKKLPSLSGRYAGAIYTPSDGQAEPALATPAIARAAEKHGAWIISGCAVRGLETEGGRVSRLVTEHGSVAVKSVICAAGAWSSLFLRKHGVTLPQLKVKASVLRTGPAPAVAESALWSPGVALRRRLDGGYTVANGSTIEFDLVPDALRFFSTFLEAYNMERRQMRLIFGRRFFEELRTPRDWPLSQPSPFEAQRVLDPAPGRRVLARALTNLKRQFPALAEVPVVERWAGLIDVTPDTLPVIAPIEALPGLFLATGFSGHGFGLGPGAGRAAAELALGYKPERDLRALRFDRF
jgi:glycine/D-amino acid oxidase-like deaminating enzyme